MRAFFMQNKKATDPLSQKSVLNLKRIDVTAE